MWFLMGSSPLTVFQLYLGLNVLQATGSHVAIANLDNPGPDLWSDSFIITMHD